MVRTIKTIDKQIKKGVIRCEDINILDLVDYKKYNDEKFFGASDTYSKMEVWNEYVNMI